MLVMEVRQVAKMDNTDCKHGRVVITTVWLCRFHLWDSCCSNTMVIKVAHSVGVDMPLQLAVT